MKHGKNILNIAVCLAIIFFQFSSAFATYDEIQVSQEVLGVTCGDGVCSIGEDYYTCPEDCSAPPPPITPDTTPPTIYDLQVGNVTTNSVEISWKTDEQALCRVFWGKTTNYELGSLSEFAFYREHSMGLSGLFPDTLYNFKIFCRDTAKNSSETGNYKFSTLALPDTTPPSNISNFEAVPGDGQVELKWKNPPDDDFAGVRILRSEKFFPLDPWNGALAYEGRGEYFIDTGLINNTRYYYTAFAYDRTGNFSSGAIVSAIPRPPGIPSEEEPIPIFPPEIPEVPPEEIPEELKDLLDELTLYDFEFWQHEQRLEIVNGKVTAKPEGPIKVLLKYEKIPEVLKTIAINFLRNDGKSFAFLLRVDPGKTAFTATLFPPEPQEYDMKIQVLDYKNQRLKKLDGELEIEKLPEEAPVPPYLAFWGKYFFHICVGLFLLLLILFLVFLWFLWKRRNKKDRGNGEKEDENSPG